MVYKNISFDTHEYFVHTQRVTYVQVDIGWVLISFIKSDILSLVLWSALRYNTLTFYSESDKLVEIDGIFDKYKEKCSAQYYITRKYNCADIIDKNE